MKPENLDLNEILKARSDAAKKSLRTISVPEIEALTEVIFPDADHPWLEKIWEVVSDPTSGTFHHAVLDDHIEVLYCHDKNIGLWFIPGIGKGPLLPNHLKAMRQVVEARP
jgi:hypothetical protein